MEVVLMNLVGAGVIVAMILTDAPTWAWLAVTAAALVGNALGAVAVRC